MSKTNFILNSKREFLKFRIFLLLRSKKKLQLLLISKNISSSLFKFLYCLENEQCLLPFNYPLFQIHFPTNFLSHLNIISSFILYSFFSIIYSFYIYFQQLYFLMKSVIFITFFAILSQEL